MTVDDVLQAQEPALGPVSSIDTCWGGECCHRPDPWGRFYVPHGACLLQLVVGQVPADTDMMVLLHVPFCCVLPTGLPMDLAWLPFQT